MGPVLSRLRRPPDTDMADCYYFDFLRVQCLASFKEML